MREAVRDQARKAARGLLYFLLFAIPFSKAAIEITFPFLFVAWIFGWLYPLTSFQSVWRFRSSRMVFFSLAAYLAVCTISVFTSSYPFLSLQGLLYKTLEYALFFLIAADVANDFSVVRRGLRAITFSALLVGIYALLQEWLIHQVRPPALASDPIMRWPLAYSRMVGPYGNPNDLATYLMVATFIVMAQAFSRPLRRQVPYWVLGLLLVGCLIWIRSRGAFLGMCVGVFLLFLTYHARRKWVWVTASILLVGAAGIVSFTKGRSEEALAFMDRSSVERRVMWTAAYRMIEARPVLGLGLNTFMSNYVAYAPTPNQGPAYAHNCFLQVAAETGLVGLTTFLLFLGSLSWACLNPLAVKGSVLGKGTPGEYGIWLTCLTAGLAAFLIQSIFDTNLYALRQAALFWTSAGLTFGASRAVLSP